MLKLGLTGGKGLVRSLLYKRLIPIMTPYATPVGLVRSLLYKRLIPIRVLLIYVPVGSQKSTL